MSDHEAVCLAIKTGEHDGHLVDIITACRVRFQNGTTRQRWSIPVDGQTVRQDDLLMREVRLIEQLADTSWASINPVNSGDECVAILAVLFHTRHGLGLDGRSGEAWDRADSLNMAEVVDSIDFYEVESAPKS